MDDRLQLLGRPVRAAPDTITIEITTRCNLTCVMCPHGIPDGMAIKADAPASAVEAVIAQFSNVRNVHPTGVGEPLLSDGFWRIVDALSERQSPELVVNTNGILLTDRNVERLMRCPIKTVSVSIDAATPDTYRKIRGSEMRKTVEGAKRMARALQERQTAGLKTGSLQVSMVLMQENISECTAFVELAADIGATVVYFEHLTEPHMPAKNWTVYRDSFRFNYAEQSMYERADEADTQVLKALDRADELGLGVYGPQLLLDQSKNHLLDRPCIKMAVYSVE